LHNDGKSSRIFWLFIISAFFLGAFLRLYMLFEQIPLDDEWHGIDYAIGNSFSYLLTHFSGGATSIPMNLYRRFLLETFGWSEFLLVLPSLSAGVLCLAVFPVFLKKIFNHRVTVIFCFLFAISPFLIFYSRVCRPYSMYVFFGFLSVLALYLWTTGGQRRYAVIYVVSGFLAVYFHFFAAIAVAAPLGFIFFIKLVQRFIKPAKEGIRIVPGLPMLTLAFVIIFLLSSVFLVPALMQSPPPTNVRADRMTLKSLLGFACILSGTANKFMVVVFWALLVSGLYLLWRKMRFFAGFIVSIVLLYLGAFVFYGPDSISKPIVISRYVIPVFPLFFIPAAVAIDSILNNFQSAGLIKDDFYAAVLTNFIAAVFVLALFICGPVSRTYARPNNFTNHFAFQGSYRPINWEQSYPSGISPSYIMKKDNLPGFYHWLSEQRDVTAVIEYPMMLGNHFNLYYYYQHFHGKRVIAGYWTRLKGEDVLSDDFAYGDFYIDHILFKASDKKMLKFGNMVDLMDVRAIEKSGAQYIILHKNLMSEMFPDNPRDNDHTYDVAVFLSRYYREFWGPPVFEDEKIVVFNVLRDKRPIGQGEKEGYSPR
jgi:hypothetical protein